MQLSQFFKSIIENDNNQVVICNLEHEILYMNPTAIKDYAKYGGAALIGQNLLDCHNPSSVEKIKKVVAWFSEGESNNCIHTFYSEKDNTDVYMVALREENGTLIGYYEKHEPRNRDMGAFYDFKM